MKPIVKLNLRGIREVKKSASVKRDLMRRARAAARQAGDGFIPTVRSTKVTATAYVRTESDEARTREAKDKILARSMDAMR